LGGPDWFQLGDKDIGTHIERTRRLLDGESLSQVIHDFCEAWRIKYNILPMSDDKVFTIIRTIDKGDLSFQDYFVKNKCEPIIRSIRFKGIRTAKPAPGVLESIDQADLIVFCPSNPWVSIDPVLSVRGILSRIRKKPTIAVSPIIQGKALKGPAAKMFFELGIEPSVIAVADHYKNTIRGLVIDQLDASCGEDICKLGIIPFITNTRMLSSEDRTRLAQNVLNFSERIIH
jgi:LPPG:FO 2-phospho-L-lactate transferase